MGLLHSSLGLGLNRQENKVWGLWKETEEKSRRNGNHPLQRIYDLVIRPSVYSKDDSIIQLCPIFIEEMTAEQRVWDVSQLRQHLMAKKAVPSDLVSGAFIL